MIVEFTEDEIVIAHFVAGRRQAFAHVNSTKPRNGMDANDWGSQVVGCLGEMAFAKATGKYWSGNFKDFKAKDVGDLQVRATSYHAGRLWLYPTDNNDDPFFLVRVNRAKATVVGWLRARDGKKPEYWEALKKYPNNPAFFVPNDLLKPFKLKP